MLASAFILPLVSAVHIERLRDRLEKRPRRRNGWSSMTEDIQFLNGERERLLCAWRNLQQTKLYDVLAALPLVSWYGASALRLVPSLVERVEQTDLHSIDSIFSISVVAQPP